MTGCERYRATEREQARTADLVRLVPKGRASVLDAGARDGHFSRLFTQYFTSVTALDLQPPAFDCRGVVKVAGDVTRLPFADASFDCVFCAEVLEHVPAVERACGELARVARHELVIGVPFRQDLRVGRTSCRSCGRVNPPWGHINRFDEQRLVNLFQGLRVAAKSLVATNREATNRLSARLMDLAGNPWGTYDQEEPCIYCHAPLTAPEGRRPVASRIWSALAARINRLQSHWVRPHANWIHMVFSKSGGAG